MAPWVVERPVPFDGGSLRPVERPDPLTGTPLTVLGASPCSARHQRCAGFGGADDPPVAHGDHTVGGGCD